MQIIKNSMKINKSYKNQQKSTGSLSGGGSQAKSTQLREDDEAEIEGDQEGMTQLRGEACKDQDKFRITVEREQRCYGFWDHEKPCKIIGIRVIIMKSHINS